ncbi:MAG: hypothetical protein ABJA61_06830 [Caldimonas sp.]
MKFVALRLLPALALVGCSAVPPAPDAGIDSAKVAAINRAASRSGVQVVWIHLPQKKGVVDRGS